MRERPGAVLEPAPPAPRAPRGGRGEGWWVLVLTGGEQAGDEVLAHARALAGPRGGVRVRPVRPRTLVDDARDALAERPFRALLVAIDDDAVGEAGARELAGEAGEAGVLLLVLCPAAAPPHAV